MTELTWLDATAQAELVRTKQVKPLELVEAAIERIERVNPQINAVIYKLYDEARTAAGGALPDGAFKGVPFLLKNIMSLRGRAEQSRLEVCRRIYCPLRFHVGAALQASRAGDLRRNECAGIRIVADDGAKVIWRDAQSVEPESHAWWFQRRFRRCRGRWPCCVRARQ